MTPQRLLAPRLLFEGLAALDSADHLLSETLPEGLPLVLLFDFLLKELRLLSGDGQFRLSGLNQLAEGTVFMF